MKEKERRRRRRDARRRHDAKRSAEQSSATETTADSSEAAVVVVVDGSYLRIHLDQLAKDSGRVSLLASDRSRRASLLTPSPVEAFFAMIACACGGEEEGDGPPRAYFYDSTDGRANSRGKAFVQVLRRAGVRVELRGLKTLSCYCHERQCECPHRRGDGGLPVLRRVQAGVDVSISVQLCKLALLPSPRAALRRVVLVAGDGDLAEAAAHVRRLPSKAHSAANQNPPFPRGARPARLLSQLLRLIRS